MIFADWSATLTPEREADAALDLELLFWLAAAPRGQTFVPWSKLQAGGER